MPDLSKFCPECGSEQGHDINCSRHRLRGHKLNCKISLGGKYCTCGYHARRKEEERPPCHICGGRYKHEDYCEFGKIRDAEEFEVKLPPKTKKEIIRQIRQKQDGTTWMVSVIGPDQREGSAWYSERAGRDAKQAAESYWKDSDNKGAEVIDRYPDETIIVVIDQAIAPSGKQWHVHLFCIEGGKIVRFPG
jgi:hypothetical protein